MEPVLGVSRKNANRIIRNR